MAENSSTTSGASEALQILHYLAAPMILVYFICAQTLAACLLHQPMQRAKGQVWRYSAITIFSAAVVTVVGQGVIYLLQKSAQSGNSAKQDFIFYIFGSALTYIYMVVSLLEGKKPVWHPLLGAVLVAVAVELPISILLLITTTKTNDPPSSVLALQVSRTLIFVAFMLGGCWYNLNGLFRSQVEHDETEPLVSEADRSGENPSYDTLPNSTDPEDEEVSDSGSDHSESSQTKALRAQQKKRLKESGSWLRYLGDFKIFIPMLWPSRDRFVQACIFVIGVTLLLERFLNVLEPRQLGIITDKLAASDGNGQFPYKSVGIYMLLAWMNSPAGIGILQNLAETPVQQFTTKSINVASFSHIMNLSMNFHTEKNSGELIAAVSQGQNLQGLLEFICFSLGPMVLDLAIGMVYLWTLFDIYMTFILMAISFAYVWVGAKTTAWTVKKRRRFNKSWRNETKVQNEAIHNWYTVSHFNRGQYECDRYTKTINELNLAEIRYFMAYYLGGGVQSFVLMAGYLAAMFLAMRRVSQGAVPVGNLVTFTLYWPSISRPLSQVSHSIRRLTSMLIDSERLLQLLTTKPSVLDAPGAVDIVIEGGQVEFEHVEFAYDPRRPTLKDLSFTAKAGQTIALVGETGGGKSTILKLLFRYYDLSSGAIRIDGQDIRGVTLDSLRDSFGMVPQDPALFNISIMENVRYARLDASEDDVKDACRAAAIHEKIESFPYGYKAKVGERGVKLSGGELQRIAIARAILRQPKIVLLDEATSMIDAETESFIQMAFKRLSANRTTFVVAHRLSTIQDADLILVINDGEIIERGTHEELIRKGGKYMSLWSKQYRKDVREAGTILDVEASASNQPEDVETVSSD